MSLINDALKKVSEAERGKPQAQAVDFEMRAMQPAVYEKRPQYLIWVSIALLAVAIGVATFVFARPRQTTIAVAPATVVTTESKKPDSPVVADTPEPVAVEPVASAAPPINTISPATQAPSAQPAPVVTPVPAGPTFRLKGILYTKSPTALINEASVHVGGEVDGATVTKIEETSVALDFEGKTITLKLAAK